MGNVVNLDATPDAGPSSGTTSNTDLQQAREGFGPRPTTLPVPPKSSSQQMTAGQAASRFGAGSAKPTA